jgi:hypothetical protein
MTTGIIVQLQTLYDVGVVFLFLVAHKAKKKINGFPRSQFNGLNFPSEFLTKHKLSNSWVDKDLFFNFGMTEI